MREVIDVTSERVGYKWLWIPSWVLVPSLKSYHPRTQSSLHWDGHLWETLPEKHPGKMHPDPLPSKTGDCWLKKNPTHIHNVRAVSWVLLRTIAQERASQVAVRNSSEVVEERPVYVWFWLRSMYSQAYISVEGYCYLRGTISVNDFNALLSTGKMQESRFTKQVFLRYI